MFRAGGGEHEGEGENDDAASQGGARSESLRAAWHGAGLAESVVFCLLASAIVLPSLIGNKAWPPALVLAVIAGAWRFTRDRRTAPIPPFMVAFIAVYAAAAIHGGSLSAADTARYFLRPIAAIAIAALVPRVAQRERVLALVFGFAAFEVPVTAAQAIRNVVKYGRDATKGVDSVTGTLGGSQAGTVTLVAVAVAALVVAAWLVGVVRARVAWPVATALAAVGVFSATRAVIGFVLTVALALVAAASTLGPRRPPKKTLAALLALAFAAIPAIYLATRALYPEAYVGAITSQTSTVLVPPVSTPARPGSASARRGVQVLPGRVGQLRLAVRLSGQDGIPTALLGRGPGAAYLDPNYAGTKPVPEPRRTGFTWAGKLLTETGWLGLAAFCGLLVWLTLLGRRLWQLAVAVTDRVLGATLVGVAALTALGAAYTTILDVRAYSAVFWILVGLAISATQGLRQDRTTIVHIQ